MNTDLFKTAAASHSEPVNPLHILLADDDRDDRYFFEKILSGLSIASRFTAVADGEKLMNYLFENTEDLPSVLFLDLNMPRKNGAECLIEIKQNVALQKLPVIIYSTSMPGDAADLFYDNGAYYYFRKTNLTELKSALHYILGLLAANKFDRPLRKDFILDMAGSKIS